MKSKLVTIRNIPLKSLALVLIAAAGFIGASSVVPADGIAGIGKAAHVNVALFHMRPGVEPVKEIAAKSELGLFQALDGKAQIISLNHTTGLKDGDVIQTASDVLREGAELEDFGIDCTFLLHVKNDEHVSMGGQCSVMLYDVVNHREIKRKLNIVPVSVGDHWTLIAWDSEDRIAIYVDEEIGVE